MRSFLDNKGFLEVETPILQYFPDSAPVPMFKTQYRGTNHEYFLRMCPEEYLKRLTLGFDRVYEIAKCFRDADRSNKHNPEFSMIEFYGSFLTYNDMMYLTEELIETVAIKTTGRTKFKFDKYEIDVKRPWNRLSIREAGIKFYNIDPLDTDSATLRNFLEVGEDVSRVNLLNLFIESKLEKQFIQPTFLTNYPIGVGVPDKINEKDNQTRDRAEAFIAEGMELVNLGSINNDPIFLKCHVKQNLINKFGEEYVEKYLDQDYFYEMEYGLPPLAGSAIGIDRLIMMIANKTNINDTVLYPFRV